MSEAPDVFNATLTYADKPSAEKAEKAFRDAGFQVERYDKNPPELFVTSSNRDAESEYTSVTRAHRPTSEDRGGRRTRTAGDNLR
jgi:hypothetical protein